jgi:hypothetical protein
MRACTRSRRSAGNGFGADLGKFANSWSSSAQRASVGCSGIGLRSGPPGPGSATPFTSARGAAQLASNHASVPHQHPRSFHIAVGSASKRTGCNDSAYLWFGGQVGQGSRTEFAMLTRSPRKIFRGHARGATGARGAAVSLRRGAPSGPPRNHSRCPERGAGSGGNCLASISARLLRAVPHFRAQRAGGPPGLGQLQQLGHGRCRFGLAFPGEGQKSCPANSGSSSNRHP